MTSTHRYIKKDEKKGELYHNLSTEKGHSGSPIILELNNQLMIVGIHKGGVKKEVETINCGRLITEELINILEIEAKRMDGDMFLKQDKKPRSAHLYLSIGK